MCTLTIAVICGYYKIIFNKKSMFPSSNILYEVPGTPSFKLWVPIALPLVHFTLPQAPFYFTPSAFYVAVTFEKMARGGRPRSFVCITG
jgi:hypothetical protein